MLDSRQLRYFVTVAAELHFGRAADRLHIAQSALSTQVKSLESRLGTRLLNRGRKSVVTLTEPGQTFLAEAKIALRQLDRAETVGKQAGRGEIGRIDIGYVASATLTGLLPQMLSSFYRLRPEVVVHLVGMETPKQLAALSDGFIDVAFVRPRPSYPDGLSGTIVHDEPLSIAFSSDHPLAKAEFGAAALANDTFIVPQFDETAGFGEHLTELAARGGFKPVAILRVRDFIGAISMAAAGYGVVPVPYSMRNLTLRNIVYRQVADYTDKVELALAYRKEGNSPATQSFITNSISVSRSDAPASN
jgi:DNA-binding transcriptional LysR family regulator